MNDDNPTMSKLVLMHSLSFDQRLIQERTQSCSLVESDDAVVGLDLL